MTPPRGVALPSNTSSTSDVTALLQQQQAVLTQILQKQNSFEKKQKDLEMKLDAVETQLSSHKTSPSSSSSDSTSKRKRVVNRALSVS